MFLLLGDLVLEIQIPQPASDNAVSSGIDTVRNRDAKSSVSDNPMINSVML